MRSRTLYHPLAVLALALLATACSQPTSRWDSAQQATKDKTAVSKQALHGSTFNKFFPKKAGDVDITFEQEKDGFAQAKLTIDSKDVGTLAISDTISDPKVAEEFKQSTEALAGYPVLQQGSLGTKILVAHRFQVVVRSLPKTDFTRERREEVIKKFDLDGLAKLN